MQTHLLCFRWLPALLIATLAAAASAAESGPLWRIGQSDNANAEFALAPKGYGQFQHDGFFVVGQSDAARDWPYVHPGPGDAWGGSRPHTFAVSFGLRSIPTAGQGRLRLDFLDTHSGGPPRLRVEINGRRFERNAPAGAGDASVFGDPNRGREFVWEIPFASDLLRVGNNEIAITTLSGSWVLYDSLELHTPPGAELAPVSPGTMVVGVRVPPVWLRSGDQAVQPVTVKLRHIGPARDATLRLAGAPPRALRLENGLHSIELNAPAREQKELAQLQLEVEGQTVAASTVPLGPPRIRDLWILPHSHVDIGYTHVQEEVVQIQITNLLTGMRLAENSAANPPGMRFKWNPEAVWVLDHFLQRASPAQRDAFLQAVRQGDVGIDGMFGNMLTALCRPEELAQCFSFGARLSNLTGVPVESAAICDVPGWTWGIVPIMAQAGIKYFAIGPNHADRVGTIHLWDNRPFYWVSQSGRERLLCWVVDNYHHLGNLDEHVIAHVEKLESVDFPYDASFLFWVGQWPNGGVDNAPPDEQTVDKVVAWNRKYAAPRLTIGLAGEFFRAFERAHGPRVPQFSGDLTPYWEDGAGSTARETALNRATADRLSQAQTLFALRDPAARPLAALDQAWKNALLYSEHTWGAWCSISRPDDPFTLDQWKVKQAFALDADQQSRELLATALPPLNPASPELEVYNTTQWERTALATVPAGLTGESVLDDRGRPVPCQRLSSGDLVFLTAKVPPFGTKRFRLSPQPAPATGSVRVEGHILRNRSLTLELDPVTGAARSLRLRGIKHDFVDPAAPVALNDYRYLLGVDPKDAQANGPVSLRVLDPGPLVATVRLESDAPGCVKLIRDVRLVEGADYVEFVNHVDRKSVREKDSVHIGFGFHVPNGRIRMETPWAVVRPNLDQLPGSCRNWFTVQRWVDISNPHCGVTWAPLDAPLMQIGGITANLLGSVPFDRWMTNALDSQTIYSWAQNNHWHTNYKVDQPGVTTFRFLVRPYRRGYDPAAAARFGLETTRPLLVASAPSDRLASESLLTLSSRDVQVETVKPSVDGRALIIGLFGVNGKRTEVSLNWRARKPTSVWLTDLTEKPSVRIRGPVEIPPFAVVYLRAELP